MNTLRGKYSLCQDDDTNINAKLALSLCLFVTS